MAVAERLRGTLHLPADKSIAHRALLLNAMGEGEATVTMRLPGGDVRSTASALGQLGAVSQLSDGAAAGGPTIYRVRGGGTSEKAALPGTEDVTLDCENSGTLMRLLMGTATTRQGRTTLTGDASLSSRPMDRVAVPLRSIGASVATTDGHAPVTIEGGVPIEAGTHTLKVASAQVLGAITLASLPAPGITEIDVPGPTRDHTERLIAWLGGAVVREGRTTRLTGPVGWKARNVVVPADPSAAAFWLVAGAIHPAAEITLAHVGLNPTRIGVIRVLQRMGADITVLPAAEEGPEPAGDVTVRSSGRLTAVDLDAEDVADVIDELPVLAVAMAAAEGTSTVTGAGELRVKESDRIRLVVDGLAAIGADATELPDGWRITGAPVRTVGGDESAATIVTDGDHRIAMAFAIADAAGVGTRPCVADDPACAAVSYPTFFTDLTELAR